MRKYFKKFPAGRVKPPAEEHFSNFVEFLQDRGFVTFGGLTDTSPEKWQLYRHCNGELDSYHTEDIYYKFKEHQRYDCRGCEFSELNMDGFARTMWELNVWLRPAKEMRELLSMLEVYEASVSTE